MYIVDNEITVTWVLGPTDAPLTAADYDINIVPSTLGATYTDDGIVNFVAPTATTAGSLQYLFTPLAHGRYRLYLTTGTNLSYTVLDEKDFWVFSEASISVASQKVIGAVSYPSPILNPPIAMGKSTTFWREIHAVGRHPSSTTKLLIVGQPAFGDPLAVGELDRNTGVITTTVDAFNGTGVTQGRCITSDPATGVVTMQQRNSVGNFYYAWWANISDLTTWTQCTTTGFNTQFDSGFDMHYDIGLDLWIWMTGIRLATSSDGKAFHLQTGDFEDAEQTLPVCNGYIAKGSYEGDSSICIMGANTERIVTIVNNNSQAAPIDWEKCKQGVNPWNVLFSAGNPTLYGGVATNGNDIVIGSLTGHLVHSTSGAVNSWTVIAAPSGNSPDNPGPNEFISGPYAPGPGRLVNINGTWYWSRGNGGPGFWYSRTDLPVANGWVQSDTTVFEQQVIQTQYHRDSINDGCRLAYAATDIPAEWFKHYVFYDEGDL